MLNEKKCDWLIFCLLAITITLYFAPYLNMYLYRDEGNWVYGAERFFNGEILYKDFFDYPFPGIYFLLVALYSIFGVKFVIARAIILVANIFAGFFIYLLSKRLKNSLWFGLLCILFYLSMILPWWDSLSHNIISITLSLLTIYLFCRLVEKGYSNKNLILCALTSATVPFFTQSTGFYVVLGGNLFIILHNILLDKYEAKPQPSALDIKRILTQLFIYDGVIFLFFLPTFAYFYAHSALGDMIYSTYIWVTENYPRDYGRTAIPYFIEEKPIIMAPFSNFSLGALIGSLKEIFIGYFQIIGFLLTAGYIGYSLFRKKEYVKSRAHYLLLFTLVGGGMFLSALYNARDWQIRTVSAIGYMLFLFWLFEYAAGSPEKPNRLWLKTLKLIALAGIFIFLAADVFWDNMGDSLDFYNNHYEIQTDKGTLTADKKTRDHLYKLQQIIYENTQPGEAIFMYYHQSVLYFLFNRRNPTAYNTIDFHYSPKQMNQAAMQLESSRPKIVFRDDFPERRALWPLHLEYEYMISNPVEKYIKQHYRLKQKVGSIGVYERVDISETNKVKTGD
jgi:hypothetical protein